MAKGVYIVGEDQVTRAIIMRVIKDYAPWLTVIQSIPARGSEIKNKITAFNKLAEFTPVILLSDLDSEPCAPAAKAKLLDGIPVVSSGFIINIAVDEAEAWLFSDRLGFAEYFGVPVEIVPCASFQKFQGMKQVLEINAPIKSSYYLTHYLIASSVKKTLKEQIFSDSSCKGKEYNSAIVPFIENRWDVEAARQNSDSLNRMIIKIGKIHELG